MYQSDPSNEAMIERYVKPTVRDRRVLDAMRKTPRHFFAPTHLGRYSYHDEALPIGHGQTISQPSLVAMMTEALQLRESDIVLEIGTGSGYQAAILSHLARHVVTIELIPDLADSARKRFRDLQCSNITVITGDGRKGYPSRAPYDRIILTAGATSFPEALIVQLIEGGRVVAPIGETLDHLQICVGKKYRGVIRWERGIHVAFVPLR